MIISVIVLNKYSKIKVIQSFKYSIKLILSQSLILIIF